MNTFKLHSTQKVKLYLVDWVEFYLLGGILPRDHLITWLSGGCVQTVLARSTTSQIKISLCYSPLYPDIPSFTQVLSLDDLDLVW